MSELHCSTDVSNFLASTDAAAARSTLGLSAISTTVPGTGVTTALAINVGTAGSFTTNGGALGTPSSGTLTSCTGLPVSTGISGLGTGVATALAANANTTGGFTTINGSATLTNKTISLASNTLTFTSAQLATACSDETGSGALVFGTSPTFTTSIITPQINGGTAANDDILIQGTTNATRTTSYVNLQPNGGFVGIGVGTLAPLATLEISNSNTDASNASGAGSLIMLDNQSATGQNVLCSFINGNLRAKWRTDYVGNVNWVASGGAHEFWTGGDAGTGGTIRMHVSAAGGVSIGNTTDAGASNLSVSGTAVIGASSIAASAQLQVDSTTKGFLPPRMTTTQKNAVSSPAEGLVVYDSTLHKLCVYTGSAWETITSI